MSDIPSKQRLESLLADMRRKYLHAQQMESGTRSQQWLAGQPITAAILSRWIPELEALAAASSDETPDEYWKAIDKIYAICAASENHKWAVNTIGSIVADLLERHVQKTSADAPPSSNERSLADRLFEAQVASCSCVTKTPAHEYHDPMCPYRLFYEAWRALSNAPETTEELATDLERASAREDSGGHGYDIWRIGGRRFVLLDEANEAVRRSRGEVKTSADAPPSSNLRPVRKFIKYKNRCLYDSDLNRYATQADIIGAVQDGHTVHVMAWPGPGIEGVDITREVLLDCLMRMEFFRAKITIEELYTLINRE